jgi:SAM-dependent methyltransferase
MAKGNYPHLNPLPVATATGKGEGKGKREMMNKERDYVLGTHDEEISRLGLQHRVWRPVVLDCWEKAGITVGKRVLDVGAGPGYATVDLAEIVGPTGEVVALERSSKFVSAMKEACRAGSLANVKIHELDLMMDDFPRGSHKTFSSASPLSGEDGGEGEFYDFSWCRWVLAFVSDPALLVKKIAAVLREGGIAIFHEYGGYETWRFAPPRPGHERFRQHVIETWRASGGEPDIGLELPALLAQNGFAVRSARPHIFCLRPNDYMWQWPAVFIEVHLARLRELGRIDDKFIEQVRGELAEAEKNANSLMLTPLVLEIVAEKVT